jgi:arabinofuranan 3-O-arabinosyltransferase
MLPAGSEISVPLGAARTRCYASLPMTRRRVKVPLLAAGSVAVATVVLYWSRRLTEAGDFQRIWTAMHNLMHGRSPFTVHGYPFFPGTSLVLWPLGLLPEDVAHLLFLIFSAGAAIASALLWGRLVLDQSGRSTSYLWGAGFVLLFYAVATDVHLGNVSCILLFLTTSSVYLALRGKWVACGALLGIGLAIKPLFVGLLLALVVLRQWRAIVSTLVTAVVFCVVGLLVAADPSAFFHDVIPFDLNARFDVHQNISIYGAGLELHIPIAVSIALRLIALIVGCYVAIRLVQPKQRALVLRLAEALAACGMAVGLFVPIGWDYYLIVLIPLVLTFLDRESVAREPLVAAALFLVGSPDILLWHHLASWTQEAASLRVLAGMVLLLVALGAHVLRTAAPTAAAPGYTRTVASIESANNTVVGAIPGKT